MSFVFVKGLTVNAIRASQVYPDFATNRERTRD